MKIVFATNNKNKLQEIRSILGERFEIVSLQDIGCHEDIPETGETLQENALLKAKYVAEHYGLDCFADDTGLEVEALHGAPGVHSARYAEGTDHNSEANMQKLLHELQDKENRKARFRTVIALLQHPKNQLKENVENAFAAPEIHYFEGHIDGIIAKEKRGNAGFGYDPLFIPNGYQQSFAELGETIKNHISHRAQAVEKLAEYLHSKINETP
ncbi:non-canonical purine NTP diphosphatase [Hoylesella timonensis]|uniref:dITP/XTP pyrophosphatase n=1 Tax=Hoylesella timonensis S9-PR14 TaxID=1401062 RepID=A0A098YPJ2_9BACT|nr:non-canonical purine NTP diphosphatase [Hoylesella timonensis]KGI21306.1 deoxyribonucleotide triphosphate pyrophosphatase [Hoylesella timonensis S9-PR14]